MSDDDVHAEIARLKADLQASRNANRLINEQATEDIDLLKAALRWCAENFTVKNPLRSDFTPGVRWMNFVKYAFVDPPAHLAAVIAEAVEQQKTGEQS